MNRSRRISLLRSARIGIRQLYPLRSTCEPHVAAQLSRTLSGSHKLDSSRMNDERSDPKKDSRYQILGFVVCGLAWGCLFGATLSAGLSSKFSAERWIEIFWVCILTLGSLGLVIGFIADLKLRNEPTRNQILAQCWKNLLVAFVVLGALCGYWLPAVQ